MKTKNNSIYILSALLGGIIFIAIYGVNILNPFYTDWLLNGGDLTQHYLGWEFYRKSKWLFPIGLTDQLSYPINNSVMYTDSIPVFAVIFKVLTRGLSERFQYFGLWGICCFILQGYYASKILDKFINDKVQVLIGSIFLILSPTVIFRMYYHTALAAQWLILYSIYLLVEHKRNYSNLKKSNLQWGILGVLIGSIHLYFLPMCGALLAVYILYSFAEEKKINLKYILPGISFCIGLLATVYILGGFSSGVGAGTADGLGYFSYNLNGLVNSIGKSTILTELNMYTQGQYEGFAYLGMGIIVLVALAVILMVFLCHREYLKIIKRNWLKYLILVVALFVLTVLAASPEITFGSKLLIKLPYSSTIMKCWGIFRSSGRLIWTVYYYVIIGAIVVFYDAMSKLNIKKYFVSGILLMCLIIQIYDISEMLAAKHFEYAEIKNKRQYLAEVFWQNADVSEYEHIVWVSHNLDKEKLYGLADWALDTGKTLNNFYFARSRNLVSYTKEQTDILSADTIYIFVKEDEENIQPYEDYHNYEDKLQFYEADGLMIGTVHALIMEEQVND